MFPNKIIDDDIKQIIASGLDWQRFNGKRIFITGGTGMLAAYIVYTLIFLNENIPNFKVNIVLLLRNSKKCNEKFHRYLKKDYFELYFENLNDIISYEKKIDFIVHAASIAITQYFSTFPIEVILPNSLGTYNLLELATKNNIESFLFFSTTSIYGKTNCDISENTYGILDPLDNNSCYTESKRFGESLCYAYYREKHIPIKIIRIAHTYGPTMDLKSDKRVFAEFIKNIINNKNIEIKSDGKAVRSFCYISDAICGYFKVLLDGVSGEAYNVSNTEEKTSISQLAQTLVELFPEKKLKVIYTNRSSSDKYCEYTSITSYNFCNNKLIALGWNPTISIKEGFKRTVDAFATN